MSGAKATVETFCTREAVAEDCPQIINLVQELADYEKQSSGPELTAEKLQEDLFCDNPVAYSFVAEKISKENSDEDVPSQKTIVGYILYFYSYSTWQGKCLYLEDIYIKSSARRKGIGTQFFQQLAKVAKEANCKRIGFAVLDWNTSAIEFYLKQGATNLTKADGWHLFRFNKPEIERMISER